MREDRIITKTNLCITVITTVIIFIKFFELIRLDYLYSYTSAYPWENIALGILIFYIYTIIFAYLSRFVGLKRGIENGYAWGYLFGLLGLIIVGILPNEKREDTELYNKYDELEKLQKLKDVGTLSSEEFEVEKAKLLR